MVTLGLCCCAQLSLVVEHRLQVGGLQWLCKGLVALQHVKFPGQGIKPTCPNWQVDSYPLYHVKSWILFFGGGTLFKV